MNKLQSETRFSAVRPTVNIERSAHDLSHGHHLTFNAGKLVPMFVQEVLPGDTFDVSTSFVNRMSTPKFPVMDTAFFDYWFFYVPTRLVWEHTKEFYGENNVSAWTPNTEYFIPRLKIDGDGFSSDGVGDHMGIPTLDPSIAVNALPLRAYRLIWNEWFRDQATQKPELVNLGDVETDQTLDVLLPLNKRKDYFTTALPEPQRGPAVTLPLSGDLPVLTGSNWSKTILNPNAIEFWSPAQQQPGGLVYPAYFDSHGSENLNALKVGSTNGVEDSAVGMTKVIPANLHVDLSDSTQITINDLRLAFAVQQIYETDARCGSRYREFIAAHFGVKVPDLTVQVPEFLGGRSNVINVSQVIQSSSTANEETSLGYTGAYSKTVGKDGSFVKSFSEPGYVIGLCGCRTLHTYTQGLDRMWSRRTRFDFYMPLLDAIGEQPIYNREIYAYGDDADEVFGYQEAYGEYRYKQSYVSGAFRSNYPDGSLDIWTYQDDYDGTPRLSEDWIKETDVNVGRTLVTDVGSPQFIVDMWFDFKAYRPMSAHPRPAGLYRQ